MSTILDTIADANRLRVAAAKEALPLEQLRDKALALCAADAQAGKATPGTAFMSALAKPAMSFICEVKKASPSKGVISEDFPYLDIARDYEAAGAECMSCLTEPKWFLGSDQIFNEIRATVATPMIRKDFTVDPYQLYEARCMGANAVLLICALLDTPTLESYLQLTYELGMVALVETHDEAEIRQAVEVGARIIGVNNRNLKDFTVDFGNAQRLRSLIPPEAVYVAESGVKDEADVAAMARIGADALLIGETLMRSTDKRAKLDSLRAAAADTAAAVADAATAAASQEQAHA